MPDAILIAKAVATSGLVAAAILLVCGWPRTRLRPQLIAAGWVLGVGCGFLAGCRVLGVELRPHWPLLESQDRLLIGIIPAAIAVEILAILLKRWLTWTLRGVLALGVGRFLLQESIYIADLAGPVTRDWI
ncbi:MAG: hypothetical protein ACRD36_12415, partial [Candidatus Acidiferrum sp.]